MKHYEALEISRNASPEMVRKAWKTLSARYHPDNRETGNETRFRQCAEAYEVLRDPGKRAAYDLTAETPGEAQYRESQTWCPSQHPTGTQRIWKNGIGWIDVPIEYPGAGAHAYPSAYAPDVDVSSLNAMGLELTEEMAFNLAATIGEAAFQSLLRNLPGELRVMITRLMQAKKAAAK